MPFTKTSCQINNINLYHFSHLLIDSKNCVRQYGKLWVPESLYLVLIRKIHYQIVTYYSDCQKTICFLVCNYYWPKIKDIIYCYIQNCHTYRLAKVFRNQYHSFLKLLLIFIYPWTDVILDFVTRQPLSNGFNSVLIVIIWLTKKKHYIPCTTDKNGTSDKTTAHLLLNNVWKLYYLSLSLILDKSLQFILGVWKKFCKIFAIKVNLSTAFHLEINEQNEIANQEIEKHLCTFINYQKDDKSEKLVIAKFAINNSKLALIKLSLFHAAKNVYFCMSFNIVDLFNTDTYEQILK